MIRVIIESPFAGDIQRNVAYAQAALLDSLMRNEAPIASHLLHTQVLDDSTPEQRRVGIQAGLAWMPYADLVAFYVDLGMSSGMRAALDYARGLNLRVVERRLGSWTGLNPVFTIGGAIPTQGMDSRHGWAAPTVLPPHGFRGEDPDA